MTRALAAACALCALGACASLEPARQVHIDSLDLREAQRVEEAPERAVRIVETPVALALPGQLKPVAEAPSLKPVSPASTVLEGASAARVEPSADGYVNAVQVYPYTEGALYQVYASPGQVCDIALQPGEILVSVSAGDTVRWVVGDTVSGAGAGARAHVLVKPVAAGLSTNLMIATDRRTYHLELTSLEKSYMAAVSWRYPADALVSLTAQNSDALQREAASVAPGLDIDDLNFDYRIEGDRPGWRPLRAFDDGRQVFIQMPPGLGARDAPPLFVLSAPGEAELVNYRVRPDYYIVDQLFDVAELRIGTSRQARVRIRRGKSLQRRARETGP